jgi:hypothetical protein
MEGGADRVEASLKGSVVQALSELSASRMADFREDLTVAPLLAGRVMSKHIMGFDTMKVRQPASYTLLT